MKVVVTWQQVTRSEVYIEDDDLAQMSAEGVDLENAEQISQWLNKQSWLAEEIAQDWYEKYPPEIFDIEPQQDDGTLI